MYNSYQQHSPTSRHKLAASRQCQSEKEFKNHIQTSRIITLLPTVPLVSCKLFQVYSGSYLILARNSSSIYELKQKRVRLRERRGEEVGEQYDFWDRIRDKCSQERHYSSISQSFSDTTGYNRLIPVPPDPDAEKQNKRQTSPVPLGGRLTRNKALERQQASSSKRKMEKIGQG